MKRSLKVSIGAAAAVGLLASGGTVLSSSLVDSRLHDMMSERDSLGDFTVVELNHTRGILESSGIAKIRYASKCEPSLTFDFPVDYKVRHVPLPWSIVRFDFRAAPPVDLAQTIESAIGSRAELQGGGSMSPIGTINLHFPTPQITSNHNGSSLDVPASEWRVSINKPAVAVAWELGKVVYRGESDVMTLKNARLDIDLKDFRKGLGESLFSVDEIATRTFELKGFKAVGRAKESGDAIEQHSEATLDSMTVAGKSFKDLKAKFELTGLNSKSLETLTRLLEDTCAFNKATVSETREAREALQKILQSGFGVAMKDLSFGMNDGRFQAEFGINLGATNGEIALQNQLNFHAKAELHGNLLTDQEKQAALGSGFVLQKADGLVASIEYAKGRLRMNERDADLVMNQRVNDGLAMADAAIKAMLTEGELKLPGMMPQITEPAVDPVPEAALPEDYEVTPEYVQEQAQSSVAPAEAGDAAVQQEE